MDTGKERIDGFIRSLTVVAVEIKKIKMYVAARRH